MKKMFLGPAGMLFMVGVACTAPALAADLLDVTPVVTGGNASVEITADIPMTYTYYNVPGQTRAVVDIADADCEKIEPLIVVNKGSIASISVDKAVISGMTVSRLIFNLVSQADISVSQQPDRKKITVSFGGAASAAAAPAPAAKPVAIVEAPPAPKPVAVVAAPVAAPAAAAAANDDDPLGLDEPKAPPVKQPEPAKSKSAAYPAVNTSKLEPVVPVETAQSAAVSSSLVKGIVIGTAHIDILANGRVENFKQLKLTKPERLAIDIPGTNTVVNKNVSVNKFGISKIRVGSNPGFTRIVLDISKAPFPAYEITSVDDGLRIMFK